MIGVCGINHKTASQDVRALFYFIDEDIVPFSDYVRQNTGISELVVLSTCHRTEIYYYCNNSGNRKIDKLLIGLLHKFKHVDSDYEGSFYSYLGIETVKHLFEVTCGLESVVIGEDQIVTQVKHAYRYCTDAVLTGAVLMRLFQKCFETSKRVRTETALQQGPTSISYVAVDLCSKIYEELSDKSVLFVGSGETGSLALQNMIKRGVNKTFIANRTFEKAEALAQQFNGEAVHFNEFHSYIPRCDIIIVATGAQNHLISKEDVRALVTGRNYKLKVFIDLSVPRNIERSVDELENVKLYGVDDLQEIVNSSTDKRRQSIEQAGKIIDQMAEEYILWFECLTLRPLIKTITTNMQKIRENEMAVYQSCEDENKFKIIDECTNRITQKYIGMFIKNLKEVSRDIPSSHSLNFINDLFEFEKKQ